LEARRGGGAKKGPTVAGEWQNRRGEDRQNCKNQKTQENKQKEAIQGNTKANTMKPNKNKIQMKIKTK
jgi:hypothetical protein